MNLWEEKQAKQKKKERGQTENSGRVRSAGFIIRLLLEAKERDRPSGSARAFRYGVNSYRGTFRYFYWCGPALHSVALVIYSTAVVLTKSLSLSLSLSLSRLSSSVLREKFGKTLSQSNCISFVAHGDVVARLEAKITMKIECFFQPLSRTLLR